jgi:hypothetical protein
MILLNNFMRRETLDGRCLRRREPRQIKHERRVCHFPLQVGRGVGLRRRLCWPRAGTVYQRGRQHSGCADRTYSGGRNGIQNHLLGKTLSRLHPDSFGLEPNTEAIGISGQSGKWKDGCVRPSSNISKALPKKSSCRRPLKAREIRRAPSRSCLFRQQPVRSKPFGVLSG